MAEGRKPAYRLSIKKREPEKGQGVIGAGWLEARARSAPPAGSPLPSGDVDLDPDELPF